MGKKNLSEGVYVATLTPMHTDLSCDHEALSAHCSDLIKKGCQGIVLLGTTGEGPSFSIRESSEIVERLVSSGFDPQKIVLANGSNNLPHSTELAFTALKHGCAAFLVSPPCFFKNVPEEGVIAFYRELILKVAHPNLRIVLYHIPQYSGVPITLKIVQTLLAEFPETVIGLKDSEGSLALTKSIIDQFPDFKIFIGKEAQIITGVSNGAAGAMSGLANLCPEHICSLFVQGKQEMASNPVELEKFFQAIQGHHFISVFKTILEAKKGKTWGRLRPPLILLESMPKATILKFYQQSLNKFKLI